MEYYYVYQITNLINNKKYFGSTNNVERRWREHKSNSLNSNSHHYNYPLQQAFRKYGLENFKFERLPEIFNTRYTAEERERELIIQYDTIGHNGYNQTIETHNAFTDGTLREGLKNKIIAIDINNPSNTQVFASVTETASFFGTDRHSISKCAQGIARYSKVKEHIFRYLDDNNQIIEPELTSQQVLNEYNRTNPIINGERHNITEWCKIYGISKNAYYKRINKGYSIIEAITIPKKR